MNNNKDGYIYCIQKIIILQVIQEVFREILIGGRKLLALICFLESLISGQMLNMILHHFEGLLHEMVSNKPFMSQ